MLKRYIEEVKTGDNITAVVQSTVKIGPVMVAAGATAALGFASLALFGVASIANFGLSCAYGIASAVLLELTLIPALRAVLPAPKRVPPDGGVTTAVLGTLERAILRDGGRAVIVGTAVVLGLSLSASRRSARSARPANTCRRTACPAGISRRSSSTFPARSR